MRPNPTADSRPNLRFDLEIGELVLQGVDPLTAVRVRADLERELAAQLSEHGADLFAGGALARGGALHLDQTRIDLPPGTAPAAIGASAARDLAVRIASRAHGGEVSLPTDFGAPAGGKP